MIENKKYYENSNEFKTFENMVKVLRYYGYYPTKKSNSYLVYKCPNCNDSSAYLKRDSTTLICNHRNNCSYRQPIIEFITEQESFTNDTQGFLNAKDKIREIIKNVSNEDIKEMIAKAKEIKEESITDSKVSLKVFEHYNRVLNNTTKENSRKCLEYLHNRGLTDTTINYFKLGANTRKVNQNGKWIAYPSIVIPLGYSPLAYNLRVIADVDKDLRYGGKITMPGEKTKINTHQVATVSNIKSSRVIITESMFDMMSLHQIRDNITDYSLCSLNSASNKYNLLERIEKQAIDKNNTKFYILLDNDKTGRAAAEQLASMMQEKGYQTEDITDKFFSNIARATRENKKDLNEYLIYNAAALKNYIYTAII